MRMSYGLGIALFLSGCPGAEAPARLTHVTGSASAETCPAGGINLEAGADVDGDGSLSSAEVTDRYPLCNGQNAIASASLAGDGLVFDGTSQSLNVDPRAIEALARGVAIDSPTEMRSTMNEVGLGMACLGGHVLKWDATAGEFTCAADENTIFSGSWNDLADKPVLFSGLYGDLSGAPDLSIYATAASLAPAARSGSWNDLVDRPSLFTGAWADLSGKPDLSVFATSASLSTVATSGSYTDLSNAPNLGGYATKSELPWTMSADAGYAFAAISGARVETQEVSLTLWAYGDRSDVWQSIVAPRTAELNRFSFWLENLYSTDPVTVSIYVGEGTTGQLLYSTTIGGIGGQKTIDFSSANLLLTAGQMYSIRLQRAAGMRVQLSRYALGRESGDPAWDLRFELSMATGHPVVVSTAGRVGVGTDSPSTLLDVAGDTLRIRNARTPSASTAPCTQGELSWDGAYVYVCVATDTWRRSALSAW